MFSLFSKQSLPYKTLRDSSHLPFYKNNKQTNQTKKKQYSNYIDSNENKKKIKNKCNKKTLKKKFKN